MAMCASTFAQDSAAQKNRRPDDDPRVTPTVKLVRQCLPALVSVRVARETNQRNVVEFGHGGGSVIHAKGYILTNNHVVAGAGHVEIAFFQGPWRRAKVVARLPSEDLALLKLDGDALFPTLPLGGPTTWNWVNR